MLTEALKHHQNANLAKAKELYLEALQNSPDNHELLHLLGILHAQENDLTNAEQYIQKALELDPDNIFYLNSMGNIFKNSNKLTSAVKYYNKALKIEPNYAVAHNSIATILYAQNFFQQAEKHYQLALTINPEYADAHFNYALLLIKQNKKTEALTHLDSALKIEPDHPALHCKKAEILHHAATHHIRHPVLDTGSRSTHSVQHSKHAIDSAVKPQNDTEQLQNYELALYHYKEALKLDPLNTEIFHNIGAIFIEQGEPIAALKYFLRQLQIAPNFDAFYNIGVIYNYQDRFNDAIQYFKEALKLDPNHIATHINMAAIYLNVADFKKAEQHYIHIQKLQPDNTEINYILDAIHQNEAPKTAPQTYIKHLFDQYAPYYDEHLTKTLNYNVPQILRASIEPFLPAETSDSYTVLDLGCGTGLAGATMRKQATKLIGIDLSAKMIAIAKQKNIYDELHVADINDALAKYTDVDLIIAADTFVYLGDLDTLLTNIKQTLTPSGIFAFSVEKTYTYPYHLQQTARFAHSKKYIEKLADKLNLTILTCDNIKLRKEQSTIIEGYVFVINQSHSLKQTN
ncbi:MAG: tetratricopeptide repeat protein [Gammaproteobacteria bacterium]|nr:tetratricopeptide repeat protein [Gammaproteobacteria bacterium]